MQSNLANNLHRCGVRSETMGQRLEEDLRVNVAEHLASDWGFGCSSGLGHIQTRIAMSLVTS